MENPIVEPKIKNKRGRPRQIKPSEEAIKLSIHERLIMYSLLK